MEKVKIMNEEISPIAAKQMMIALIEGQINQIKIERLQEWVHQHDMDESFFEEKIAKLQKQKDELMEMCNQANMRRHSLMFTGSLDMTEGEELKRNRA